MNDGHLNLMASHHHHHAGLTTLEQDGAGAAALSSSATTSVIHQNGSKPTTKRSHRFRRRSRVPPPRASESYRYNYQQQQGDDDEDDDDESDSDDDCYQDEGDYVERRHHQHLREHKNLDVLVAKKKKAKIITKPRAKPITFSNPLESHRLLTSSSTAAATIAAVAARRHWETSHATRQDRNNDSFQTLATVSTTASASTAAMYDDGSSIASSQERVSPQRKHQYSKTVIPNPLYPPPPPPPCLSAAPSAAASNKMVPSLRSRRPRTLTLTATPPKQALFNTNAANSRRTANELDVEDDSESFLPSMPLASSNTTTATAFADVATDQQAADTAAAAAGNGIRPSLDAGMAAVRRWIQSKSIPSATLKTPHRTAPATRPITTGKTVANVGGNNSSNAVGEDDEEDWLSCVEHQEEEGCDDEDDDDDDDNDGLRSRLLRDLQDQASSLASDSNIMFYNSTAIRMRNTDSSEDGDDRNLNPSRRRLNDLDDAVVGSSSTAADNRHRQRALSEPNGLLLRDDIFQRALQGGFRRRSQRSKKTIMDHSDHHIPSRSHTTAAAAASERSRQFWNDNLHVVPLPAAIMRTSNHTSMASSSHDPTTFMFHKNTATIAALSQRSTFFSDSEDDFGANVTVPSSSRTFEMTPIVNNSNNNNNNSSSTNHSSSVSGLIEPAGTNQVSYLGREDATAPTMATTTPLPSSTQPLPSSTGGSGADGTSDQETPPPEAAASAEDPDPNRASRLRWIRINRRFQLIITVVALIFSLLLFGILVCWVVLTSAYVVSIDKICDVPLKPYFWLVTLQLILDVFRSDIMRLVCRWDANSRERIPCRVISYNILYLTYALLVLRLGIRSVYIRHGGMCRHTAPELYQSSAAFVTLSIAAWSTIILGYLVPFCFVATLLTWNGYTPASDADRQARMGGGFGGVFPSTSGAPPGCIDQMRVVLLEEFPHDFPRECCICIGDFASGDEIVATTCNHVFHKQCCREWLRQARTCPVCRADIPTSLSVAPEQDEDPNNIANGSTNVNSSAATTLVSASLPSNPGANRLGRPFARDGLQHEVVSLLRFLRQHEDRILTQQQRQQNRSSPNSLPHLSNSSIISPAGTGDDVGGRTIRLELPPAPSSAPMSTSRHGSLVPSSQSDGDLASMEEGLSTSSNHHQHSM